MSDLGRYIYFACLPSTCLIGNFSQKFRPIKIIFNCILSQKIQKMMKMMMVNLTYSMECVFLLRIWYCQYPHAQLSICIYHIVVFILHPNYLPNGTQLLPVPEHEKHDILCLRYLIIRSSSNFIMWHTQAPFYSPQNLKSTTNSCCSSIILIPSCQMIEFSKYFSNNSISHISKNQDTVFLSCFLSII